MSFKSRCSSSVNVNLWYPSRQLLRLTSRLHSSHGRSRECTELRRQRQKFLFTKGYVYRHQYVLILRDFIYDIGLNKFIMLESIFLGKLLYKGTSPYFIRFVT